MGEGKGRGGLRRKEGKESVEQGSNNEAVNFKLTITACCRTTGLRSIAT